MRFTVFLVRSWFAIRSAFPFGSRVARGVAAPPSVKRVNQAPAFPKVVPFGTDPKLNPVSDWTVK